MSVNVLYIFSFAYLCLFFYVCVWLCVSIYFLCLFCACLDLYVRVCLYVHMCDMGREKIFFQIDAQFFTAVSFFSSNRCYLSELILRGVCKLTIRDQLYSFMGTRKYDRKSCVNTNVKIRKFGRPM